MKLTKLLACLVALSLCSCAGTSFSLQTPYGSASRSKDGNVTITPNPYVFVVPEK